MASDENKSKYYTSDFGCCVALVALGHKVVEVDRRDTRRVRFAFLSTELLLSTVEKYRYFDLKVDARKYFESSKAVKSIIYGDDL